MLLDTNGVNGRIRQRWSTLEEALRLLGGKSVLVATRLAFLASAGLILPLADFASISAAMSVAEIVRFAVDWGTDTLAIGRLSVGNKRRASRLLRGIVFVRILSTFAAFGATWVFAYTLIPNLTPLQSCLVSVTACNSLWFNISVSWLQSQRQLPPLRHTCLLVSLAPVVLWGLHALGPAHFTKTDVLATLVVVEVVIVAWVLRGLVAGVFAGAASFRGLHMARFTRVWLNAATPIALAIATAALYTRLDQIVLVRTAPAEAAGKYAVAFRLVEPFVFLSAALGSTLHSRMRQKLAEGAQKEPLSFLRRTFWLSTLGFSGMSLGAVALAWMLMTLFDAQHSSLLPLVALAASVAAVRGICVILSSLILGYGRYRGLLLITFLVGGFYIVGMLVAGSLGSAYAMAMAVLCCELISACLQYGFLHRLASERRHLR